MLGDEYVKAEFRLHRKIDNPGHLVRNDLKRLCATLLEMKRNRTSRVVKIIFN